MIDGLNNIVIASTSAKIAFNGFSDLLLRWVGVLIQQIGRSHDHTGGTKTTLEAVLFFKAFLQWMQAPIGHTFYGSDFVTIYLCGKYGAGFYSLAIHKHCTGPTTAGIAAYFRRLAQKKA